MPSILLIVEACCNSVVDRLYVEGSFISLFFEGEGGKRVAEEKKREGWKREQKTKQCMVDR